MTDPLHTEPVEVTQLRVASDRFYPGLHYIEGGPFRILFWTIATNIDPIDPVEGVRRLRFADELVAAWNTRTAAEAASRQEVERLREALATAKNDLLTVGNDYPGSSCQKWCTERALAAWNVLEPWKHCPSTHCERSQECRAPNECSATRAALTASEGGE